MEAGRELDALVIKAMGWDTEPAYELSGRTVWMDQFHPSTDIAAAFEVTKKCANTWVMFWHDAYSQWQVKCDPKRQTADECRFEAWAFELPAAICVAALRMCGEKVDFSEGS